MKILFGIQGTGHGHISRAREILPELQKYAEVEVLVSGYTCKLDLDGHQVNRKRGISLVYDKKGRVSLLKTLGNMKVNIFMDDMMKLRVTGYDLIISDFEPISSWAARKAGIPVIGLSHQASFLTQKTPRPAEKSYFAEQVLRHYAPCTFPAGFHFMRYDDFIQPPVIRSEVRRLNSVAGDHVTVYLPAYDDDYLAGIFSKIRDVDWELFSTHVVKSYRTENCLVRPVNNEAFLKSIGCCHAVITGGGFETCAETLFLNKKLMVIPIRNQYEQQCNAAALSKLGVTVLKTLNNADIPAIKSWLEEEKFVQLPEYCKVPDLIERLICTFTKRGFIAA